MVNRPEIFLESSQIPAGVTVVDATPSMLGELFSVRNPSIRKGSPDFDAKRTEFIHNSGIGSVYIYYPWRGRAIKTLPEAEYFELRTARNRHLITEDEQKKFREGTVAVAGLSVGSAVLHSLVQSGGPKRLKIADMDIVETTNLNRLRAGLPDVGSPKTDVASRMVWDIDPYAEIENFPDGVTLENIEAFVASPRLSVLVDEIESIEFKLRMRLVAKREKIPVVMATDSGNGIILDIERYDLDSDRPAFHGLLGEVNPDDVRNLSFPEWLALANKIVGINEMEERMRSSIAELGISIPSIPQLGASATFAGSAVTYAVRTILAGAPLASGRYRYTLESLIKNPEHA